MTGNREEPIEEQIQAAILEAIQQTPYHAGTVLETFTPDAVAIIATNAALNVVNPWVEGLIRVAAQTVVDETIRAFGPVPSPSPMEGPGDEPA